MTTITMIPTDALLKARENHQKHLQENPEQRPVCDDTITPFSAAMKSIGFTPQVQSNGCVILRQCPNNDCKKSYSTLFTKNDAEHWGCPHCQQIRTD